MTSLTQDNGRVFLLEFLIEEVHIFGNTSNDNHNTATLKDQLVINFSFLDLEPNHLIPCHNSPSFIKLLKDSQLQHDMVKVLGVRSCLFSMACGQNEPIDESTLIISANLYRSLDQQSLLGVAVIPINEMYRLITDLLDCGEKNAYSSFMYKNFKIKHPENDKVVGHLRGCVRLSCFDKMHQH